MFETFFTFESDAWGGGGAPPEKRQSVYKKNMCKLD